MNYVLGLASKMQYYPTPEILKVSYFMEEFEADAI
jgi:hypothetical protein